MGVHNSLRTSTLGRNRSATELGPKLPESQIPIFSKQLGRWRGGGSEVGAVYPTFQNCLNSKFPIFSEMGGDRVGREGGGGGVM